MGKEIITVGAAGIENKTFHSHKSLISIYDENIDSLVVSNKASFGKRGFQ